MKEGEEQLVQHEEEENEKDPDPKADPETTRSTKKFNPKISNTSKIKIDENQD